MKPRLPHSSREGTGAPSLRLAEAVSLQQEKQRFLFHSEPRCSRRLEGPPPSAVCRGMPAPPPPHPGCSLTLGASPVGSWDTVQALGLKLTRTPANCRCRGAGGPKPGAGSEHCGVARERGCSGRSPPGPGTGWLLRGTSPRPLPSTQHGHVQGACRAAGSIPGVAARPQWVGQGQAGLPGGQSLCSAPRGSQRAFRAPCRRGHGPWPPRRLAEAHPHALTQTAAPGRCPSRGPLQTGDRASPVRKTENGVSACRSGASPQPAQHGGLPPAGVGADVAARLGLPAPPARLYGRATSSEPDLGRSPCHPC